MLDILVIYYVSFYRFHKHLKDEPFVNLHICNLAAQTGVTRFTQMNDHWQYSKNESLQPEQLMEYTHLLVEAKSKYSASLKVFTDTHVIVDSVDTFAQISINSKLIPPIKIKTRPAIFILERKDFREFPREKSQFIDADVIEDSTSSQMSTEEKDEVATDTGTEEKAIGDDTPVIIPNVEDDYGIPEKALETEINIEKEEYVVDDGTKPATILEEKTERHVKKAVDGLKLLRKERKQKAIAKIKSETRKQVVASAKERLRELMKRHKHITDELEEKSDDELLLDAKELDGRGDIPEQVNIEELSPIETTVDDTLNISVTEIGVDPVEDFAQSSSDISRRDLHIDDIVEEVIQRLIDRKIYDHKTKPDDIRPEDRQIIQQIVEEVLAEKMNYTNESLVNKVG